jgi:acetoacetyl-CoA synthetase
MPAPLWTPSPDRVAQARLTAFRLRAAEAAGAALPDYDALWQWSVDDPAAFWSLWAREAGVRFHTPPEAILEDPRMPGATWFRGATLNFAEHLLRGADHATAILAEDERGGPTRRWTFAELRRDVAALQAWLVSRGVGAGDRVAAWLPNRPEAVIGMLATSAIGAVWSSSSPDFGVQGVLDRFGQIAPKVLIVGDGSVYGGKAHRTLDRAQEVASKLPSVAAVLVVGVVDDAPDLSGWPAATAWRAATAAGPAEPSYTAVPFDHPLFILYSSGTTGAPKCIVHGVGGTLLQHTKEHQLHTDVRPGDVLFWYTTTGWMMWNWLVSGLASGATIVLWDGSPVHPTPDALWSLAARHRVTAFGTSPKFLAVCAEQHQRPGEAHDLSAMRALLSTGSPLSAEGFAWAYANVKADVQLASISGGTDIISCFMLGSPVDPVYPGEIQKRGLGMRVEAWRSDGTPVVGERAELVCTAPFPSAPVGFWGDADGSRYRKAYFEHFPGVWRHGDFIELTPRGGVIVTGRSDATLNPGGVRIGTAEIYGPVEAMPEVSDAVVVGLPDGDDVEVVLFIVVADGVTADAALAARIRARIRDTASPRHVPRRVLLAPAIPRTISGKKVEIAVLQALRGEPIPNRDALANPEALDWFVAEREALCARPTL